MTIIERVFDFDEKQAARILGIAPRTLRAWRVAGRIGHSRTPTGRVRYSTDQLLAVERVGRVAATIGANDTGAPVVAGADDTFSRLLPHSAAQR